MCQIALSGTNFGLITFLISLVCGPIYRRVCMTSKLSRVRSGKETLENFEIFKGLPAEAVDAYSRRCVWKRFETHQPLIRYKDATRDVFFISSGRAAGAGRGHARMVAGIPG